MDRIKFDVSGKFFVIKRSLLLSGPESGLKDLCKTDHDVIVIDRPPDAFGAIVGMYQTGELHVPNTCCLGKFIHELKYWNISTENLATCCYFRLQRFQKKQQHLKKFQRNMQASMSNELERNSICFFPTLNSARNKVWFVVDYKEKTPMATVYFFISLVMVLISISNLALSTHPDFRRNMTGCERLEFMERFAIEDLDYVADMLKAECENTTSVKTLSESKVSDEDDYEIVEVEVQVHEEITVPTPTVDPECINLHNNSSNQSEIETEETWEFQDKCSWRPRFADSIPVIQLKRIKIPNFKIPVEVFSVLELVTLVYFTTDISLRLLSCPSMLLYFTSVVNLADALALLGAYMHLVVVLVNPKEQYETNWYDLLEYLQMLRSFRLFRLVMTFNISKVLLYSVEHSMKDGFIMVLLLISGMCVFSTCLYLSEDKLTVRSIPDAWYWSIITMTTVGYGDIVPKSALGQFIACLCSVCGVLVFALTVPLFVNQFMSLHQYAEMGYYSPGDVRKKKGNHSVNMNRMLGSESTETKIQTV